jgi:hypothetical protein
MPNSDVRNADKPLVETVLCAVADWINKYRYKGGMHDEFGRCSPDDVMQIAKDLGIPAAELRVIANKGPGAADLVQKMLVALKVDPAALEKTDPATMRDLQRLCAACSAKGRCEHELAEGTAAVHFPQFCPNAFTLDALVKEKAQPARH